MVTREYFGSIERDSVSKDSVPKSVYTLSFFIFANLSIFNKIMLILKNYKWGIYKYLHSERRFPLVE